LKRGRDGEREREREAKRRRKRTEGDISDIEAIDISINPEYDAVTLDQGSSRRIASAMEQPNVSIHTLFEAISR
jgi:hypothetical protein